MPPAPKWNQKTFNAARAKMISTNILCRKRQNGISNHLMPLGQKWYQ
jgi:hypothetical protein